MLGGARGSQEGAITNSLEAAYFHKERNLILLWWSYSPEETAQWGLFFDASQ